MPERNRAGASLSRTTFLGVAAGAAAPLLAGATAFAAEADVTKYPLPKAPIGLSAGNARAAAIAERSPVARAAYARVAELAHSLADAPLRDSILALLADPTPRYALRRPTASERTAVRDALAAAGLVAADAPVAGIFPPGTESHAAQAVQPFWSTPGSSDGSHHAYPGGLGVHEYFNASMAEAYAQTYDRHYFADAANVERDTVVGAALYHDIMKTVVFQYHPDGSLFDELQIGNTGGHHVLSGAEAIARGRSPRFVTTLLSAHAAPSLGDEAKVALWCRGAAIVAGVDPVEFGLLKKDGSLAADPVPLEAFINKLSDHDYVLSVHAMHVVSPLLNARYLSLPRDASAPSLTPAASLAPSFAWYRHALLSQTTAIALYDTLARNGNDAFQRAVSKAESAPTFGAWS